MIRLLREICLSEGRSGVEGIVHRQLAEVAGEAAANGFMGQIPRLRQVLRQDLAAALAADPAAAGAWEILDCYPGFHAVVVHRIAHALLELDVPRLPRILAEQAHSQTGIDIHPGARIGPAFFIDHGTGVVIGQTTQIGSGVKIYQGVTLGALSTRKADALRGIKRHPTVEDDVTIYANATILGGNTVIGRGSIIGANVFLTESVAPNTQVTAAPAQLHFRKIGE